MTSAGVLHAKMAGTSTICIEVMSKCTKTDCARANCLQPRTGSRSPASFLELLCVGKQLDMIASGISKPRKGAKVLALVVAIACVHSCASLSSHVVTTAEELQLAIRQNRVRIEIKDHIDFGELTDGMISLLDCTPDLTIWV